MATASYVVITPVSNLALSLLASCLVFQYFDIICDLKYVGLVVGKMQCSQRKQLTFYNFSTDYCEIRPGEWVQKFHSDDASFLRSGKCFWLVEVNFLCGIYKQKYKPDVGSSTYIGMQFMCSFLRHHFTGEPVVTLWNVCFFLMLNVMQLLSVYLYFLLSFASLEDGTTQTTTSPLLSLLLCSQIWRETTDIVHASHSMKDALQESQRKN